MSIAAIQTFALFGAEHMMLYVAGLATVLLIFGLCGLYASRDRTAGRVRAMAAGYTPVDSGLSKRPEATPRGWKKGLIPQDSSERAQIGFQLAKVGFDGPAAVEGFFVIRLLLALLTPFCVLVALGLGQAGLLPQGAGDKVATVSNLRLLQITVAGTAVGFYGTGWWLRRRIKARQNALRAAFPNAMDLIQISVEAGLGFDAAVTRVGQELGRVAPELAYEFLLLQLEIQAGRDREAALFDMADRMGLEEARAFALVIAQSLQFGTSLTHALRAYAAEMRQTRELTAQEKANRLPVQMSGVMSCLMLPALFLITLTPIVIRYLAMG